MRSYIFTDRERRIIKDFLEGRRSVKDRALSVILARVKGFQRLASDVELYLRLRKAITANPT